MILDLKNVIKSINKIKAKASYTTLEPYLVGGSASMGNWRLPNDPVFLNQITKEISQVEKEIEKDLIARRDLPENIVGQSYFKLILTTFRDDERVLRDLFLRRGALQLNNRYCNSFERLPTISSMDDIDYI